MANAPHQLVGPISAVRIAVHDLAAARGFYRDALGLTELAFEAWAIYESGAIRLIIEPVDPDDPEADELPVGRFRGVSFTVEDAVAVCAELRARGVAIVGEPAQQEWGGTLAHIADPSGNVLTLVQY